MKKLKFLDKNWVILLISLLLGGVAAWSVGNYMKAKETEMQERYSRNNIIKVPVIVATRELNKGDIIDQSAVAVREVPQDYLAPGAMHPRDFAEADGQMLLDHVAKGQPILRSFLPGKGVEQFSDIIADGRRAVTISIDERNSNAGMLVAGDKVDLFLLRENKDEASHEASRLDLLIERVTVLATGKVTLDKHRELVDEIYSDPSNYSTVTLDLSAYDAARVTLAKKHGDFVALLRNRRDALEVEHQSVNSDVLFNNGGSQRQVEIIIGGQGAVANGVNTLVEEPSQSPSALDYASKNKNL
ncbi:Flp pilus assembly protein CpaB [Pseudoalteromonas sp. T1lg76]|uniref:Flp pilus assembly protein CpaB n=1 Tax=Pseudoalteromonas sp. T1lg76 TaxID=2077103 RepID=UPI000CF7020A|nr:Flp pilus assembly protein CpaB [Pseudoalteromonas sp. T1lg76]